MLTENGEFLSSCLGKDSLFLHTNPKGRCLSGMKGAGAGNGAEQK